jgi:hypothetical protein
MGILKAKSYFSIKIKLKIKKRSRILWCWRHLSRLTIEIFKQGLFPVFATKNSSTNQKRAK